MSSAFQGQKVVPELQLFHAESCRCWESNLDPHQEQPLLWIAKPFLPALSLIFLGTGSNRTWNMARKTEKVGKFRNVHCRTWNMARKLKIMENEKQPLDHLKNDEITEKREKWEMHTVGPGIWRENWKSWKMKIHTLGREVRRGKLKKVENLELST